VRQELGLELGLDVLSAGWVGTLPSCATGETRSGPFVCNEFQELFVIRTTTAALDALELDAGEVAAIQTVAASDLLAALEAGDEFYVPRPPHYRRELRAALGALGVGV